jgi:phosphatidylglycerophosphate synthase
MVTSTARPNSRIMNVPNSLTISRVILTLVAAVFLITGNDPLRISGGIILIVAWATDWLDGFLARRLSQTSVFGAVLDLIADRILMDSISIITIVQGYWQRTQGLMPFTPYPYLVIVWAADFTLLIGLVIFVIKRNRGPLAFPAPPFISRLAFPVQMLTLVLSVLKFGPDWLLAALMYLTIISTLIASYIYLKKGGYIFTAR